MRAERLRLGNEGVAEIENAYNGRIVLDTKSVLSRYFSVEETDSIWLDIKLRFSSLADSLNLPQSDEDALFYILPSVAIYDVLKKRNQEQALKIFEEIYFISGQKAHDYLVKRLHDDESFLKSFPQDFLTTVGEGRNPVIVDTPTYTEFHVEKCRFLELTKKLACPELCSVFCAIDDLMYKNIHPKLVYSRDNTLFAGDECCNFSMRYLGE